jgi:hypothetical protein
MPYSPKNPPKKLKKLPAKRQRHGYGGNTREQFDEFIESRRLENAV